jgi:hypothetical protein
MSPHKPFLLSQAQWYTPAIPVLRRQRQEDHEFDATLGYIVASCLNNSPQINDK